MLKVQLISVNGEVIKEAFSEDRVYLGYKVTLDD